MASGDYVAPAVDESDHNNNDPLGAGDGTVSRNHHAPRETRTIKAESSSNPSGETEDGWGVASIINEVLFKGLFAKAFLSWSMFETLRGIKGPKWIAGGIVAAFGVGHLLAMIEEAIKEPIHEMFPGDNVVSQWSPEVLTAIAISTLGLGKKLFMYWLSDVPIPASEETAAGPLQKALLRFQIPPEGMKHAFETMFAQVNAQMRRLGAEHGIDVSSRAGSEDRSIFEAAHDLHEQTKHFQKQVQQLQDLGPFHKFGLQLQATGSRLFGAAFDYERILNEISRQRPDGSRELLPLSQRRFPVRAAMADMAPKIAIASCFTLALRGLTNLITAPFQSDSRPEGETMKA
jgi:hypothetical protein